MLLEAYYSCYAQLRSVTRAYISVRITACCCLCLQVSKVDVRYEGPGHRSLVANQPIKKGDVIMTIHASNILNAGASDGGFLVSSYGNVQETTYSSSCS